MTNTAQPNWEELNVRQNWWHTTARIHWERSDKIDKTVILWSTNNARELKNIENIFWNQTIVRPKVSKFYDQN